MKLLFKNTMSHLLQKKKRLLTPTIFLLILVTIDKKMIVFCIHLWKVMKMDL